MLGCQASVRLRHDLTWKARENVLNAFTASRSKSVELDGRIFFLLIQKIFRH